ncbi:TIGR03750 family conjugal transfer protein [Halorhodospira abdelmalekii]|uniref:TIGR03750 family conjugal transfer protein n=1 Tax=Halorhodospira abdelmalekii TaxID=421629 RepID=UPI001F5C0742|nr:TIGR03750 family conjugal transfer protein [Halorhodospira abdelmalekii]
MVETAGERRMMAERLNEEPPVFRGCSSSELVAILTAGTLFWLPVGIAIGWMFGRAMMGIGGAAIMVLATVFVAATIFQKVKKGRPTGYYQQRFRLALHRAGLMRAPVILRSGSWDVGRR